MQNTIGFLGGGNMTTALLQGLVAQGIDAGNFWVYDRNPEKMENLKNSLHIQVAENITHLLEKTNTIILAVKPQTIAAACENFKYISIKKRWISIAAGIRTTTLEQLLPSKSAIIRAMPNTPVVCRQGATGLYANTFASEDDKALAEAIFQAVGITVWAKEEADMDKITALSGSGPAYFFLFFEALLNAAENIGMHPDTARSLILQTAQGATTMAKSMTSWQQLREQVTSRGGTTEAGISVLKTARLGEIVEKTLIAAENRAKALSK